MAHRPPSLEETLSQDTDLVLYLTHFTNEESVDGLTAALQSNRNVGKVYIQVAKDLHLSNLWHRVYCTGYHPSLVRILEALEGRESLEDIIFVMIDLAPPEHAAAVRRFLRRTPNLKRLQFISCPLSLNGARTIAKGLREGPSLLESFRVSHCLTPLAPIARPADSTLLVWTHIRETVFEGDGLYGDNRNAIAIALVEGTSRGDHNSLKVLNLEYNELADKAVARIIRHLTERQAPLERILSRGNDVGLSTVQAIAGLLVNSTTLTEVDITEVESLHFAERNIVCEGLRYNFDLEEFNIHYSDVEGEVQNYLQRNRTGREAIQNERRDQWLELLIQNQDNLSALYYYLRKCPAWIYGHAD